MKNRFTKRKYTPKVAVIKAKNPKKQNEISYHTDEKLIALFGLNSFDSEINGQRVRYYYPSSLSFFQEPDVQKSGRHIVSKFSNKILKKELSFQQALSQLREQYHSTENHIDELFILEKMQQAIKEKRLPENSEIDKRLAELREATKEPKLLIK